MSTAYYELILGTGRIVTPLHVCEPDSRGVRQVVYLSSPEYADSVFIDVAGIARLRNGVVVSMTLRERPAHAGEAVRP